MVFAKRKCTGCLAGGTEAKLPALRHGFDRMLMGNRGLSIAMAVLNDAVRDGTAVCDVRHDGRGGNT